MSLTNESGNGLVMPVSPINGGGFGGFGGDWGSLIVLFLIAAMFGGFGGGWGGFGNNNAALGVDFPWLLNGQNGINANTNAGFDQAATNTALTGIQGSVTSGFGDVQTALCGGFAGVTAAVNNAQNAVAQQLYTNQIADLERSFAAQTANTQGMTALQGQLAQCCCDNRLATANLQSVIQSENCADRAAISDGIRDLLTATQAQNQKILDKLCDQELMAERRENDQLRTQLNMANLAASQNAQTASIVADNALQTQYIVNRVAPYPTPSYIVANPNGVNTGCGCGCGSY